MKQLVAGALLASLIGISHAATIFEANLNTENNSVYANSGGTGFTVFGTGTAFQSGNVTTTTLYGDLGAGLRNDPSNASNQWVENNSLNYGPFIVNALPLIQGSDYTLSFLSKGDVQYSFRERASINGPLITGNSTNLTALSSSNWDSNFRTFNWGGPTSSGANLVFSLSPNSAVDDIRIESVSAVPEPGEWAMMLAGLGVVGVIARRRKAQSA